MQRTTDRRTGLITAGLTLVLMAWDVSGLDLPMAYWSGGPGGFALRDNWFLSSVAHDAARHLAWLLALAVCLAVWFPVMGMRRLPPAHRLQFAAGVLLAVTVVSSLKVFSAPDCPWSLLEFGGLAHHASHWSQLLRHDRGSGGCFPAGHASAGFAFLSGYFAFRHASPVVARRWLVGSVVSGLALGLAQQVRGAHFMSHTLWSGWICWCTAWGVDAYRKRREPSPAACSLEALS